MIRLMNEEDLEQVAELENACFQDPWSYGILAAGVHSPYDVYYVFVQGSRVVGYANLRLLAQEAEVQRIAVLPKYRKTGVGRELMDTMVSYATERQVAAISLEVRESNVAARNLYESYGFLAEARRKDYYHNPTEDAIMMWKRML